MKLISFGQPRDAACRPRRSRHGQRDRQLRLLGGCSRSPRDRWHKNARPRPGGTPAQIDRQVAKPDEFRSGAPVAPPRSTWCGRHRPCRTPGRRTVAARCRRSETRAPFPHQASMAPAGMPMHHDENRPAVEPREARPAAFAKVLPWPDPTSSTQSAGSSRSSSRTMSFSAAVCLAMSAHEPAQQPRRATTLPCNQQRFTHPQPPIVSPCPLSNFFTPTTTLFAVFQTCAI